MESEGFIKLLKYARLSFMLIAHGPLGYLLARGFKRYWTETVSTPRQTRWLYIAAFIGGIFPDTDLFYFYFLDASVSHRQLITHSFILYFVLLALGYLVSRRSAWRFVGWGIMLFALGCLSHILADMYAGMAAGLAPLSQEVFGLQSWWRIADSWFGRNNFLINYLTEYALIVTAILITVRRKRPWLIGIGVTSLVFVATLVYISQHVFRPDGNYYYSDPDQDDIVTMQDRDSDGDGLVNMIDEDLDNDGEDNSLDFYKEIFATEGALYDYTNGGVVEIPLRIGLVTPAILIERLYSNSGIFFATEMAHDYAVRPQGYVLTPKDDHFADLPANWQVWLQHTHHLLPPNTWLHEFDILFFESGHVGILVRENGVDHVLEADASHWQVQPVPLTEVIEREGGLTVVGRVLPKPFNKRY